jgi:hypothetical protein
MIEKELILKVSLIMKKIIHLLSYFKLKCKILNLELMLMFC